MPSRRPPTLNESLAMQTIKQVATIDYDLKIERILVSAADEIAQAVVALEYHDARLVSGTGTLRQAEEARKTVKDVKDRERKRVRETIDQAQTDWLLDVDFVRGMTGANTLPPTWFYTK